MKKTNVGMKGVANNLVMQGKKFALLGLITAGVLASALLAHAGDVVPYHSKTIGQMVIDPASGNVLSLEEIGIGTHLGKFTLTGGIDEASGYFLMTAIAANGDKLYLVVVGLSGNTVEIEILNGTGRLEGATGHLTATSTVDPNPVSFDPLILAYTGTVTGEITTVGSNKK